MLNSRRFMPRATCYLGELARQMSTSAALRTRSWRSERGLPANPNAEGPLLDGADYTFLDGRPTPLLSNQRDRLDKQRGYAQRIVLLNSELEFAVERERRQKEDERSRRENILSSRLKPKGKRPPNK